MNRNSTEVNAHGTTSPKRRRPSRPAPAALVLAMGCAVAVALALGCSSCSGGGSGTGVDSGSASARDLGRIVDAAILDAGVDAGAGDSAAPTFKPERPYERAVDFGWIAAGQPDEQRVREVVMLGARVISLRYPQEDPFDEKTLIEGLGGTFIRYATNPPDLDDKMFRAGMYDLYDAQIKLGGPVYLHCASSNRVGATWALYHYERLGLPPDQALQKGKDAGLSSLTDQVRRLLGL